MSNIMPYGEYEGKSFEWIFFHQPHYANYIKRKGMAFQDNFGEEQGNYFLEIYRRAKHLAGTCPQCQVQPITYLGLIHHNNTDRLGGVGFYCDDCDYQGGSCAGYYVPSFFVRERKLSWANQKRIAKEIKRHYIGRGSLTQAKMEEFFQNDANFVYATPGFFAQQIVEVAP